MLQRCGRAYVDHRIRYIQAIFEVLFEMVPLAADMFFDQPIGRCSLTSWMWLETEWYSICINK